jgi:hypothetical protein
VLLHVAELLEDCDDPKLALRGSHRLLVCTRDTEHVSANEHGSLLPSSIDVVVDEDGTAEYRFLDVDGMTPSPPSFDDIGRVDRLEGSGFVATRHRNVFSVLAGRRRRR